MKKLIAMLTTCGFIFLFLACPQDTYGASFGRIIGFGLAGVLCFAVAIILDKREECRFFLW